MLILFSYFISATYSTDTDEWGNMQNLIDTNNAYITVSNQSIPCFAFESAINGYLSSFGTYMSALNDDMIISISADDDVYDDGEVMFSETWDGNNPFLFSDFQNKVWVYKDVLYWVCLTQEDGLTPNSILANYIKDYYPTWSNPFHPYHASTLTTTGTHEYIDYALNSKDLISEDGSGLLINGTYTYTWLAGVWSLSAVDRSKQSRYFKICVKEDLTDTGELCFSRGVENTNYQSSTATGDDFIGEKFYYTQNDGYTDYLQLWLYGGSAFSNGSNKINFILAETDNEGNVLTLLNNQTNLSTNNIKIANATLYQINFTVPILFEDGHYYKYMIACDGCLCCNDVLHSAGSTVIQTIPYFNDNSSFGMEYSQALYQYKYSGTPSLNTNSDGVFKFHFTSYIEKDQFSTEFDFCQYAPVTNCIYYEPFDSLSMCNALEDYDFNMNYPNAFYCDGQSLISNHTYQSTVLTRDFEDTEYTYSKIEGLIRFYINNSFTPIELDVQNESKSITWNIQTYNENYLTSNYMFNFFWDSDYFNDRNYTLMNIYTISDTGTNLIGTYPLHNGEYYYIQNIMDFIEGKSYLFTLDTSSELDNNIFDGTNTYNGVDIKTTVKPTTYGVSRTGSYDDFDEFVVIDYVLYFGLEDGINEDIDNDYIFYNDSDNYNISDVAVSSEFGDMLHNLAFDIGFRSSASKLAFWIIILIIITGVILYSPAPSFAKTGGVIMTWVLGIIIGYYFKFINTTIFAFVIFIIAFISAIAYQRLFKSSSSGA